MITMNQTKIEIKPLSKPFENEACNLFEAAFPIEERRPSDLWVKYHYSNEKFEIKLIFVDGIFQGILTYWNFDDFIYIEHFATLSTIRGRGIGSEALNAFIESYKSQPIVLEVEPPIDSITQRRINFYERHGFTLTNKTYIQPPYYDGLPFIPLRIMCNDKNFALNHFDDIVKTIKKEVYNYVKRD